MNIEDLPPSPSKGLVHVVVETPRNSIVKLKYEPELGLFVLKRALSLGFAYPYDWGFVPGTEAEDGDPLDALVVWEAVSPPGTVLKCRALGVLELSQKDGKDRKRVRNDRVLCVPEKDPRTHWLRSVNDLPERVRDELAHFFVASVFFEKKDIEILGWAGADAALAAVTAAASSPKKKKK
jgi:inorganic pyrophosphatase